ncbi:MAG: LON peptidase substrate-binding domain-containing protein [Pseudomonadales bacterium]
MTEELPLFPLGAMLFPGGRISLQIFEPRYMDMVKRCLRDNSGFGVVAIRSGSEVVSPGTVAPTMYSIGVVAHIVDWHGLEYGRIGITAEGSRRFKILSSEPQEDQLLIGDVEYLSDSEDLTLPTSYAELAGLLKQLARHPSVEQLGMSFDYTSVNSVAYALAQLLPIANEEKFKLLDCDDAHQVLARIRLITDQIAGFSRD